MRERCQSAAGARRREFAIRSAIGAAGGRLIRQVLTEGALLAAAGGVAGLALGRSLGAAIASHIDHSGCDGAGGH